MASRRPTLADPARGRPTSYRTLVAASVLDCNLADLGHESRRVLKAGADRLHLDVMDGHFVPNISFGPMVIRRLRHVGRRPFDAHLMIAEPGRYLDDFIEAGCDSITFHVEVEEPIEPTLLRIRKAGRLSGLAIKPATPVSALEPYRDLLDIVMVMTVEPGFGGQGFIKEAASKILPAHKVFRGRPRELPPGQVHVDGGVNRSSAGLCGVMAADVLVVGSALWKKGGDREIAREIRLIKALAEEGYANGAGKGNAAIPHDAWTHFVTLPRPIGRRLMTQMEATGIPVIQIRAEREAGTDGPRPYELLIPAGFEDDAGERFGEARQRAAAEARAASAGAGAGQTAPKENR
jgi:ribulose-phosphate 3-epimerase